jgi:hypothetical protein
MLVKETVKFHLSPGFWLKIERKKTTRETTKKAA